LCEKGRGLPVCHGMPYAALVEDKIIQISHAPILYKILKGINHVKNNEDGAHFLFKF
jgi:hypothetical protein